MESAKTLSMNENGLSGSCSGRFGLELGWFGFKATERGLETTEPGVLLVECAMLCLRGGGGDGARGDNAGGG